MFFLVTLVAAEVGRQEPTTVKPQRILYPYTLLILKLFQIILSLIYKLTCSLQNFEIIFSTASHLCHADTC